MDDLTFETADVLKLKTNLLENEFYILAVYRLHKYTIDEFSNEIRNYFTLLNNGCV